MPTAQKNKKIKSIHPKFTPSPNRGEFYIAKKQKKNRQILRNDGLKWLRRQDLNLRPSGYEPDELPNCSTPRYRIVYCALTRVPNYNITLFAICQPPFEKNFYVCRAKLVRPEQNPQMMGKQRVTSSFAVRGTVPPTAAACSPPLPPYDHSPPDSKKPHSRRHLLLR